MHTHTRSIINLKYFTGNFCFCMTRFYCNETLNISSTWVTCNISSKCARHVHVELNVKKITCTLSLTRRQNNRKCLHTRTWRPRDVLAQIISISLVSLDNSDTDCSSHVRLCDNQSNPFQTLPTQTHPSPVSHTLLQKNAACTKSIKKKYNACLWCMDGWADTMVDCQTVSTEGLTIVERERDVNHAARSPWVVVTKHRYVTSWLVIEGLQYSLSVMKEEI